MPNTWLTDGEIVELVRRTYARERFPRSYDEVVTGRTPARAKKTAPARVGQPPARVGVPWRVVVGVVAAATLVAGLVGVQVVRWSNQGQRAWQAAFTAECTRQQGPEQPAVTFFLRDGGRGLLVLVTDHAVVGCTRDESGRVVVKQLVTAASPEDPLFRSGPWAVSYLAVVDAAGGPEYFVGAVPKGADRVVALQPGDTELSAVMQDGYFVIWAPDGGLAGTPVLAYAGTRVLAKGIAPTYLRGNVADEVLATACSYLTPDPVEAPPLDEPLPLALTLRDGEWALQVYGTRQMVRLCELADSGLVRSAGTHAAYIPKVGWSSWAPLGNVFSSAEGGRTWVVTAVAPGTERVEAFLDGQPGKVTLGDGFFAAVWHHSRPGMEDRVPERIVAYTPQSVFERDRDGTVRQRPR